MTVISGIHSFTLFSGRIVEKLDCFDKEGVENSVSNNDNNNYGNLKGAPTNSPIVNDNYARKCTDIVDKRSKDDDCVVLNEHNYVTKLLHLPQKLILI